MKPNLSEFYKSLEKTGIVNAQARKEITAFAEQLDSINFAFQMYFPATETIMKIIARNPNNPPEFSEVKRFLDMNSASFARSRAKHDFSEDTIEIAYNSVMQRACYPDEKGNPLDASYKLTSKGYSFLIEYGRIGSECIGKDTRTVNRIKEITEENEKYLEQIIAAYQRRSDVLDEICTLKKKDPLFSQILQFGEMTGKVNLSPQYGFDVFDYLKIQSDINRLRSGMIQFKVNELKQENINPNWNFFLGKY